MDLRIGAFLMTVNILLGLLAVVLNLVVCWLYEAERRKGIRTFQAVVGGYIAVIYLAVWLGFLADPYTLMTVRALGFWLRPAITVMLAVLSVDAIYIIAYTWGAERTANDVQDASMDDEGAPSAVPGAAGERHG